MAARFLLATILCPLVLAFSDTFPLVAWSSHRSNALDSASIYNTGTLLESILSNQDVCNHDAVALVSQQGLHASDLRSLSPSSNLARSLASSPSSRQFQYVTSHPEFNMYDLAESLSVRCGSRVVYYSPGQGGYFSRDAKYVFSISMPTIETSGAARKALVKSYESQLADEISQITSSFPNHLIIYTGSSSPLSKRQAPPPAPTRQVLENIFQANTTLPDGGILKRYQLLTPGLIMGLLVAFFILIPVAMMGFSALASIQSPLRVEPPKGFSASEKKSQ